MQVIVNSLLINYTVQGKGKTVLLVHGWGDSSNGMEALQGQLAKKYQVVALDLPGFGGTQTPDVSWGLDDYADFVADFVAKLKLAPETVVGHSNGGAILIRALTRHLQARKLVLVASAGIRGEYKGRKKALRIITKAGKALTTPLPGSVKKRLRKKVYTTVGSDMLVAEHLQETFKRVVEDDVRADAQKLTLPTLLIYGDQDTSTPLRHGQMLHEAIMGSELVVVPGGEHWLPTDNTTEVALKIKDFIS